MGVVSLFSIGPVLDVPGSHEPLVLGIYQFVQVDEVEILVFRQVLPQRLQTLLFGQDFLK